MTASWCLQGLVTTPLKNKAGQVGVRIQRAVDAQTERQVLEDLRQCCDGACGKTIAVFGEDTHCPHEIGCSRQGCQCNFRTCAECCWDEGCA